jgi:hypothetical protein
MIGARPMDVPEFNRRAAKYLQTILADDDFNSDEANLRRLARVLASGVGVSAGDQLAVYRTIFKYRSLVWDRDAVRFAEERKA